MMSAFYLKVVRVKNNVQKINLSGALNEEADFNKFSFPMASKIHLDLEEVEAINIQGIKKWQDWFKNTLSKSTVTLINCPPCIVFQFTTVKGFLPSGVKIESFYVPYYNNKSNRRKNILFKRNHEFKKDQIMAPALVRDDYGEEMEIDVNESLYFSFIFESQSL